MLTADPPSFPLLRLRARAVHARGDTYGIVCAAILIVSILAGIVIFRAVTSPPPATVRPPGPQPLGYARTVSEGQKATPAGNADDRALSEGMEQSRLLAEKHLRSRGVIVPAGGSFQARFEYEKKDVTERLEANGGTFARQGSSPWVRGDHFSAEAPNVSAVETSFLDDLVKIVRSPWEVAVTAEPTRSYPSASAILYAKGAVENKECLFSFRRIDQGLRFQRFSGPLHSGGDEVEVTLDYDYPDAPLPAPVAPSAPEVSPMSPIPRALPVDKPSPGAARKTKAKRRVRR